MASPESLDAGKLYVWLFNLIEMYVERTDLGQVYGQRIAFRLSDEYGPEPDIAFVQKSRLHLERRGHFERRP